MSGTGRQSSGRHRPTTPRKRRLGLVNCPRTPCPYRTGRAFPQCHNSPRLHGNASVEPKVSSQFMLLLGWDFGAYLSEHFRCARAHGIWPIAHSLPHHRRAGHIHKTLCCPWPEIEHCTKLQQVRSVTASTRDNSLKWNVCVTICISPGSGELQQRE